MKRILLGAGISAAVLGGLWGGLTVFRNVSRKPVNVYKVQDVAMEDYWQDSKEAYGYVTANKLQNVYLSSTETVTGVLVSEGQQVKTGDPLFTYDTTLSDLNVKKAENDLLQKKRSLEKAKALLEKLKRTKPYTEPPLIDPIEPDPGNEEEPEIHPEETPKKLSGEGTRAKPFVYLWGEEDELNDAFFREILGEREQDGYEPDTYAAGDPALVQDTPDADAEAEAEDDTEQEAEEVAESEQPMQPVMESNLPDAEVYLILERHMNNDPDGEIVSRWGVRLRRKSGRLYTSLYDPMSPAHAYEDDGFVDDGGSFDGGAAVSDGEMTYTKEELAQAINDTTKEIRDTALDVKLAEVELKRMKAEVGDGTVRATLDGVVKKVADPNEAYKNNKSFITVSAGGGYTIEVPVSELLLHEFSKGQTVSVMSNQTQETAEGTVEAMSIHPVRNDMGWSNGNPNVSYYPCRIFVDESAELKENDFVTVTYEGGQETDGGNGSSFYLEGMFIRSDVSGSYVYIKNEEGLLEKRKVVTGKNTGWGAMEIKQGVTLKDRIAFPYGSNVMEHAKTKDAEIDDLYSGM